MMKFEIDGHTIEFGNGCSNLDPWCNEYCQQIGLSLMATADVKPYIRIDGEKIYKLKSFNPRQELMNVIQDGTVTTWEEINVFFSNIFDGDCEYFSQLKKELDETKIRNDNFKKMSPEEKKKEIKRWREERKNNIKKLKNNGIQ